MPDVIWNLYTRFNKQCQLGPLVLRFAGATLENRARIYLNPNRQ